jgi:hypothetical protein
MQSHKVVRGAYRVCSLYLIRRYYFIKSTTL